MASIKFRLKDFREENKIFQGEIAGILGVNQATISRLERLDKELTGYQYDLLARKYGEELVSRYVGEETVLNAIGTVRQSRGTRGVEERGDALAIIREQQQEIARLNKRIEELTNIIINR